MYREGDKGKKRLTLFARIVDRRDRIVVLTQKSDFFSLQLQPSARVKCIRCESTSPTGRAKTTHSRTPVSNPPLYACVASPNAHARTGARWSNFACCSLVATS